MAASPKLPRLFLSAGLENVLRMSPTRSLLHLLGRGAGPVIRRVWTLTCDRETRRPRPRRDGAKPTVGDVEDWRDDPRNMKHLAAILNQQHLSLYPP